MLRLVVGGVGLPPAPDGSVLGPRAHPPNGIELTVGRSARRALPCERRARSAVSSKMDPSGGPARSSFSREEQWMGLAFLRAAAAVSAGVAGGVDGCDLSAVADRRLDAG